MKAIGKFIDMQTGREVEAVKFDDGKIVIWPASMVESGCWPTEDFKRKFKSNP